MNNLTPAQQRQQNNRTSDGKYTAKQHAEADVSLNQPTGPHIHHRVDSYYDEPGSPFNNIRPHGEQETSLLPPLGPGELDETTVRIANVMQAQDVETRVEYGRPNPFNDPDGYNHLEGNDSVVHFYRQGSDGQEKHFATGYTTGRLADTNVYGAEVMRDVLYDISKVENTDEHYPFEDWADAMDYDFDDAKTGAQQYAHATKAYATIQEQRRQLIDFFEDESLVDEMADIA